MGFELQCDHLEVLSVRIGWDLNRSFLSSVVVIEWMFLPSHSSHRIELTFQNCDLLRVQHQLLLRSSFPLFRQTLHELHVVVAHEFLLLVALRHWQVLYHFSICYTLIISVSLDFSMTESRIGRGRSCRSNIDCVWLKWFRNEVLSDMLSILPHSSCLLLWLSLFLSQLH